MFLSHNHISLLVHSDLKLGKKVQFREATLKLWSHFIWDWEINSCHFQPKPGPWLVELLDQPIRGLVFGEKNSFLNLRYKARLSNQPGQQNFPFLPGTVLNWIVNLHQCLDQKLKLFCTFSPFLEFTVWYLWPFLILTITPFQP